VKTGEEGMVGGEGEDPLLCHGALHVVVLDDHVLLQNLKTDTNVSSANYYEKLKCSVVTVARILLLSSLTFTFKKQTKDYFLKSF
jgi:hypothetical protein